MNNQTRTNQGGSVVSFLIVGVVLAVITLGGIYLVQQRNNNSAQPSPSSSSPSPVPPPASQATSPSVTPSPSKSPSPSVSPKPSTSASPAPTSHPTTGTAPASGLPATGPADDLVLTAIPSALLLAVIIGYLKSYKTRFGSFRR